MPTNLIQPSRFFANTFLLRGDSRYFSVVLGPRSKRLILTIVSEKIIPVTSCRTKDSIKPRSRSEHCSYFSLFAVLFLFEIKGRNEKKLVSWRMPPSHISDRVGFVWVRCWYMEKYRFLYACRANILHIEWMNEKGKRTQNEKRITKWKQKPFSILIIYLRARIAWIVACRSDSVSYWYTAAIANEENHMWNKYIHDACVHIRRKTQWIQNAEWTQQWIYLVVTQTPSIKPSKMDLSWNTDLCFSSTPSPSLVQQRESERASEWERTSTRVWKFVDPIVSRDGRMREMLVLVCLFACCVYKIVGFYEIIHTFYIFWMQIRTDVHSIRLHV